MKPLIFQPILKQTLWGGNKIVPFLHSDSNLTNVGESWQISGVPGNETKVIEGEFAGKHLADIIALKKEELVGKAVYETYGTDFPLLIKFIDANQPLSIQVHPTDELARKQGKIRGKTEMWYVMQSDPDAGLLVGLKKHITPEEYKEMVANNTITDVIDAYSVKEGDCFFLPAGRIHSIGKGCFLAEIQQSSDVTYRIYDFNRKDKNGQLRELHTKEAAESIDFNVQNNYRTYYVPQKNEGVSLVQCPYFNTLVYDISQPTTIDLTAVDSFFITIIVKGKGVITDNEGNQTNVKAGNTLLYPATTKELNVEGNITFLGTYV